MAETISPHVRPYGSSVKRYLHRLVRPAWMGTLRRTAPLSAVWGWDRGTPVDRYYIDRFLASHRADIRGRVLEVQDSIYTKRFGCAVNQSDVLDIDATNRRATIVADLSNASSIASNCFDCFIVTQTLQFVYDVRAALVEAHRILRPGGVLLATLPHVSKISPSAEQTEYWRFTPTLCSRLFLEIFGPGQAEVRAMGNVLSCIAFLTGLAAEELRESEMDAEDRLFPLVVTVRAVK